jgi:hypothetical protein
LYPKYKPFDPVFGRGAGPLDIGVSLERLLYEAFTPTLGEIKWLQRK